LPWSTKLFDPIALPNGKKLVTLKDAATYITGLPKKESGLPEWQTAIEVLLLCGDPCWRSIGLPKALHRSVVKSLTPTAQRADEFCTVAVCTGAPFRQTRAASISASVAPLLLAHASAAGAEYLAT
jgi:hypothetical protein